MTVKTHFRYDDALQEAATAIGKPVAEVRAALQEFYEKVAPKQPVDTAEGREVSTRLVSKPDIANPILEGPSVIIETKRRKPVEIGISRAKLFDRETMQLKYAEFVKARRPPSDQISAVKSLGGGGRTSSQYVRRPLSL